MGDILYQNYQLSRLGNLTLSDLNGSISTGFDRYFNFKQMDIPETWAVFFSISDRVTTKSIILNLGTVIICCRFCSEGCVVCLDPLSHSF